MKILSFSLISVWFLVFGIMSFAMSLQTSIEAQILLGLVLMILLILLKPLTSTLITRIIFVMLASTLVLRYYFWRLFSTLPEVGLTPEYFAAVTLLAVESIAIVQFFITVLINLDPKKQTKPPQVLPENFPTVDVLIPTYNEPVDLVKETAIGAVNMVYPKQKLNIYICDDGGTDDRLHSHDKEMAEFSKTRQIELKKICHELGITYLTRPANINAKAGNLTSALESTNGELVVVLDADHIPSQDFLARTVGYFEDLDLFLVQTPHHFINSDPIHKNLQLPDHCPYESEMFYGHVLESLDRWNGAFFCGSAAIMRRKALDSIGGISGLTITEDAETALDLHAMKWKSLYLNEAMVGGLQPETFAALITQRGRWATGMLQISLLKNPFFRRGLTMQQRFCYLSSVMNWFFPLTRLTFTIAPLLYLFFGINFFQASFEDALVYTVTYAAASLMIQNVLFKHVRWPLISEVYEIAQAPYLIRSLFSTLISPRKAQFSVTAKDEVINEDSVSAIHWPLTSLMLVCFAGLIALVFRWFNYPETRGVLSIVGGWTIFNFIIVSAAWQAIFEKKNLRQTPRVSIDTSAKVFLPAQKSVSGIAAKITDASTFGFKITIIDSQVNTLNQSLSEGETLIHVMPELDVARYGKVTVPARICRSYIEAGQLVLGCVLEPSQDIESERIINLLIFGESDVWRKERIEKKRPKGLLLGIFFVIFISLSRFFINLYQFARHYSKKTSDQKSREWNPNLEEIIALNNQTHSDVQKDTKKAKPTSLQSSDEKFSASLQAKPWIISVLTACGLLLLLPEEAYSQTILLDNLQAENQIEVNDPVVSEFLLGGDQLVTSSGNKMRTPDQLFKTRSPIIPVTLKTAQNSMKYIHDGYRYRMSGERAVSHFNLWLPKFAITKRFEINFQNSIHILEQYSNIIVELNGKKIIEQKLNGVAKEVTLSSQDIEPKSGLNSVTIFLEQRHRVFCGPQASFDIWTDINLAKTGFVVTDFQLPSSIEGIAAGIHIQSLHGPLSLRAAPDLDAELATNIAAKFSPVIQQNRARINFKSLWDPVEGYENYFRVLISEPADGPSGLSVSADGAILYRITSVKDPIFEALGQRQNPNTSNMPKMIKANQVTSLFDLGYQNTRDVASYGSNRIQFVLPYDWLVLDNRKALLNVSFDYSPLITEQSIFNIKVNNETIYTRKMGDHPNVRSVTEFVEFNASLLKGGLNQIESEYLIPAKIKEAQCPDFPETFVTLKSGTSLLLPNSPQMYLEGIQNVMPLISRQNTNIEFSSGKDKNVLDPEFKLLLALKSLTVTTPEVLQEASENIADQSAMNVKIINNSDLKQLSNENGFFSLESVNNSISMSKDFAENKVYDEEQPTTILQWKSMTSMWERFMESPERYKRRVDFWLENNRSQVALLKPNPHKNEIFVAINPDMVTETAFDALSKANLETFSPAGALSVLGPDNVWYNWVRPNTAAPRLLEPLSVDNLWLVASNVISIYATEFLVIVIILVAVIVLITFLYLMLYRKRT